MTQGGPCEQEPHGRDLESWLCQGVVVTQCWPDAPSPWHCHCGATWEIVENGRPGCSSDPGPSLPPLATQSEMPPGFDTNAYFLNLQGLSDEGLYALGRAVGKEQSRRYRNGSVRCSDHVGDDGQEAQRGNCPRSTHPTWFQCARCCPELPTSSPPRRTDANRIPEGTTNFPAIFEDTPENRAWWTSCQVTVGERLRERARLGEPIGDRSVTRGTPSAHVPACGPVPRPPVSPRAGRRAQPAVAAAPTAPACTAYVTSYGRVWHRDPECKHLYHCGKRRPHIRAVAVTQVDLPPCEDCRGHRPTGTLVRPSPAA